MGNAKVRAGALVLLLALACAGAPGAAHASCNQIPGTVNAFRSSAGVADRPFASPGDFVELTADPECRPDSPGFAAAAADHVVTVAFKPTNGPRFLVAVAGDCAALPTTCADDPTTAVHCVDAATAGRVVLERTLRLDVPRLRFRFPDTDALVDAPSDERTLTGPAAIAVTAAGAPLPCALARDTCAALPEAIACVDALFETDGTCGQVAHSLFPHFTALPPPNDYQALCTEPSPPCTGRATEMHLAADAAGNLLLPVDWTGVIPGKTVPVGRFLAGSAAIEAFPGSGAPIRLTSADQLHSFSIQGALLPPLFEPRADPSAERVLTLFGTADAERTVLRIARQGPDGELFDLDARLPASGGPLVLGSGGPGLCRDSGTPCASDADCAGGACSAYRLEVRHAVAVDGVARSGALLAAVVPEEIEGADLNGDGDAGDEVVLLSDRVTGRALPIGVAGSPGRAVVRVHEPPYSYPALVVEGDTVAFLESEPHQGRADLNGDGDDADTILRVYRYQDGELVDLLPGQNIPADADPRIDGAPLAIRAGRLWFRQREWADAVYRTRRVSVSSEGVEGNGASRRPAISGDGRWIAFESEATNLTGDTPPLRQWRTFLHDRLSGETRRVKLENECERLGCTFNYQRPDGSRFVEVERALADDPPITQPSLTRTGDRLAVVAPDLRDFHQVWVLERDLDGDGVFDQPGDIRVRPESEDFGSGILGFADSLHPWISPAGESLTFLSYAWNVHRAPTGHGVGATFRRSSEPAAGGLAIHPNGFAGNRSPVEQVAPVSEMGGYTAFATFASNLVPDDDNEFCFNFLPGQQTSTNCADVYVADANYGIQRVSVSSEGVQGDQASLTPAISLDGRVVAYQSFASKLVAGDTNGLTDVFVASLFDPQRHTAQYAFTYDPSLTGRRRYVTTRVSLSSTGEQADGSSFDCTTSLSADGRWVAFSSNASNLVAGDGNAYCDNDFDGLAAENCNDVFRHDRVTGFTERVGLGAGGVEGNGRSSSAVLPFDGSVVAFHARASNLVAGDGNDLCDEDGDFLPDNCSDVFVAEPDPADFARTDLTGDGDAGDTVLRFVDLESGAITTLCPAGDAALAGDGVAFLRPEAAGAAAGCPAGPDLDGNGATIDEVVHSWQPGEAVENLGLRGVQVAASEVWIATMQRREGVGAEVHGPASRVHDRDHWVHVHRRGDPAGAWTDIGQAATRIWATGDSVVYTYREPHPYTPRYAPFFDRELRLYDGEVRMLPRDAYGRPPLVEDVVVGDGLVAFRTREWTRDSQQAQGPVECRLNPDADCRDSVLQVYDTVADTLYDTGQAATPCALEACNPRQPYAVARDTVKFLTLEGEQGEDLDGDGRVGGLVLQSFNVRVAARQRGAGGGAMIDAGGARTRARDGRVEAAPLAVLGSLSLGVCTTTGASCSSSSECGGGTCFIPPGGCTIGLDTPCNPTSPVNQCGGADTYCLPSMQGLGTCRRRLGPCESDGQCPAGASCIDAAAGLQRMSAPFQGGAGAGETFVAGGRCVESTGVACDPAGAEPRGGCAAGERCDALEGGAPQCRRGHGACTVDADCPGGARCEAELVVAVAADADGDEIADPLDNCAAVFNPAQEDEDGDGVGDACQRTPETPSATVAASATVAVTPPSSATPTVTSAVSATPTAPAPASATPSAAPSATPTLAPATPTRTATTAPASSSGGCHAGAPAAPAAAWPLLALLAIWCSPRHRSRDRQGAVGCVPARYQPLPDGRGSDVLPVSSASARAARVLPWLAVALLLPTPARAQLACVGDCDGDGRVTRAEIVIGARIALGEESPDACPSLARGAAVGVDDLVTGVRNSADGCIEKLGAAQVGPSLLMLRALTRWAVALGGSFNGFNSEPRSGGPSTVPDGFSACGLSGTETRSCEEPADGVAAIRFELDRCAFNAVDLAMEVDGALRLFGSGLCPGILLPGENWTEIETEQIVRRAGEVLWVQQHQLGGILHEMVQGFAICPLAAISFTMSGPTRQDFADGTSLQLDVRSGRLSVAFLPIGAECAPALITARFDGEVTLFDDTAEPPMAVRARAEDFEVEVRRGNILGNRMDVRGRLASECLGMGVRFAAAGQPPPDLASACVFGGEVELSSGQHRARVRAAADGSLQIDAGADGSVDEVFASCLDAPLRAGGGCVELATPTPRPTPTPTLPPAWPQRIRGDLSYPPENRARQSGVIGPGECFDVWNEPGGSACGGRHDVARCCVDDDGYLYAHYVNCAEGEAEGEHVDSRCSYAFKGHTARCCFE